MNRSRSALFAVLLVVGLLVGPIGSAAAVTMHDPAHRALEGGPVGGAVLAQTAANTTAASSDEKRVARQVDEDLVVADFAYNESENIMTLTFRNAEGGGGSSVTVTESITRRAAESSDRFGIKSFDVPDGETLVVEVDLYTSDPIGVMVVSDASREAGRGSFIALPGPDWGLFRGEATWGVVRAGVLFAMLASLLLTVVGAWHLVASRNEDVQEVDLDPDERRWSS